MRRPSELPVRFLVLLVAAMLAAPVLATAPASAQGTEIGFEEEFALAKDREAALEKLIPGTEEYYYYHCLHYQNTGALEKVEPMLRLWRQRHGRTGQVIEIENRQALLSFEKNPRGTLEFLRDRLGLRFNQQRQAPGAEPDLPSRLDPALVSRDAFVRRALQAYSGSVDGFHVRAFDFLVRQDLDPDRLHSLLQRLERPDLPNLPALVVRDLDHKASQGFGSLTIHRNLLLDQLEACVSLRTSLLDDPRFIETVLVRLVPDADTDWRRDAAAREAFLDRLETFVRRLAPAHNSLKAHVLYHRLAHDHALGVHDKERFLAYLRLPRTVVYVNPRYLEKRASGDLAQLDRGYPTGLPPVRNDEPLVRAYFEEFFRAEDSWQPYAELVREDWLKRVFAETKILYGIGDMERWYSLLDDPGYYERLKERVEIEFVPTLKTEFRADEPVSLELELKNVDTLLVKVFEIDTFNYAREQGREIDSNLDLDGLVPNEETTCSYDANPLRRHRERFDFPRLAKPGVYVVDFIGNGLSSRAVIRKGRLRSVERVGAAGHVFRVFDESNRPVPEASIWIEGREFPADDKGEIVIPFSTQPGRQTILLRHGGLTTLEQFFHLDETYTLAAGIFVDRESLLPRHKAKLLVRPTLLVQGRPASLSLLEDPVLEIRAVDHDGVASTQEVRNPALEEGEETVHEFLVPERLASLVVRLRGRVRNVSRNETIDVATEARVFEANAIDATQETVSPLLSRTDRGYLLRMLGKNGEPAVGRVVTLRFRHADFLVPVDVSLETDAAGTIELGALEGIESLEARNTIAASSPWRLAPELRTWPAVLHGREGETLRLPAPAGVDGADRADISLLEVRGGVFFRDRFDRVAVREGFYELGDLPAGDYDLWLKRPDVRVTVRVARGEAREGWILGATRLLEERDEAPLQITSAAVREDALVVRLANAGPDARVHVLATRFDAAWSPFENLVVPGGPIAGWTSVVGSPAWYLSGREIGDEYRYILERRYAKKFPGNMLKRPGLLLNPWALEETATSVSRPGGAGGAYRGPAESESAERARSEEAGGVGRARRPGVLPNVDFLPEPSVILANLRPDADGRIRVPLADLGAGQEVHILAVDPESTVYRSVALGWKPLAPRERRLALALDPDRHFTEQKRVELVEGGETAVVEDLATASVEPYDSLERVWRLYLTLSGNPDLKEFEFILRWPKLSAEEKRELYSKNACHELHFFLYQKDRPFFDEVVRPYLANKMHKTFLDEWLLGMDLARHLDPWAYARLNLVERILLAQRIEGEADAAARHIRDLHDLVPPDRERWDFFFSSALQGSALEGEKLGEELAKAKLGLEERKSKSLELADRRQGATPPAAAAPAPVEDSLRGREENRFKDAEAATGGADYLLGRRARKAEKEVDAERRAGLAAFWSRPDRTREYVEHNYRHLRIEEQDGDLIPVNGFWLEFAEARGRTPFFSSHFPEATSGFAEMMFALSILDLPLEAGKHESKIEGARLELRAANPILLFRKEILEAKPADERTPILVSQNFFRLDDRYRYEGNERLDKYVTGEFLAGVVYGCEVVLTNPTSSPQKLELLLQIPRGAIPVLKGVATRSLPVRLEPYSTATREYHFYFPGPGAFAQFPVHVSQEGKLLAFAQPAQFDVVSEPSTVDTTSWDYVSQNAEPNEVLAFLEAANLQRLDLSRIAWRMRDRGLFDRVLALLRARHVYDGTLWSYAIHHGAVPAIREYLRHQDGFLAACGRYLDCALVTIDPIERRAWQMIEYEPLFNPRAHRFGKRPVILNDSLAAQYLALLEIFRYRPVLDDDDRMTEVYYLLLQDRIEEALDAFARVRPEKLATRLQYDYMRTYLAFFTDEPETARTVAEAYRDHPVERWRARFRDVLHQLDEAAGKAGAVSDAEDRTQTQTALAAAEPTLEIAVEARQVTLRYRNVTSCEIAYYPMDVEFLFSTNPFVKQEGGAFAFVRPNRIDAMTLPPDRSELVFDLPEEFRTSNLLVEARAAGKTVRQAYYANALSVELMENYGQIRVTHAQTGRPLPKVYVKVFAREEGRGTVRFHKDGYTDLRGRFDYASLSGEGYAPAERYAILVLSETDGAVIREAAPPKE